MFPKHALFDSETLNRLYHVYADAGVDLDQCPEGTSWKGSDDDRRRLATRILSLAATGERDALRLKRAAIDGLRTRGR